MVEAANSPDCLDVDSNAELNRFLGHPVKAKTAVMKPSWFKRGSRIYEPVHIVGFAITLLIILFLVPVYVDVILNGYSAGDDLYHMFVYSTCTILMGANGV